MAVDTTTISTVYASLINDATGQLNTLLANGKITGTQYAEILSAQMATAMQLSVTSVQQQPLTDAQITKMEADTTRQDNIAAVQIEDVAKGIEVKTAQIADINRGVSLKELQVVAEGYKNTNMLPLEKAAKEAEIDNKNEQSKASTSLVYRQAATEEAKRQSIDQDKVNKQNTTAAAVTTQYRQAALLEAQAAGHRSNLRVRKAELVGETLGMAAVKTGGVSSSQWRTYSEVLNAIDTNDDIMVDLSSSSMYVKAPDTHLVGGSLLVTGAIDEGSQAVTLHILPENGQAPIITSAALSTDADGSFAYTFDNTALIAGGAWTGQFSIILSYKVTPVSGGDPIYYTTVSRNHTRN